MSSAIVATHPPTRPQTLESVGPLSEPAEDPESEDDGCEECRSEESDDAGSLVDFVVDDDTPIDVEKQTPRGGEQPRDLDGIDAGNIVLGKRQRRPTQFFERGVFASEEYRKMMLCDIPRDELHAVLSSDEGASGEDEDEDEGEDGDWKGDSEGEDSEGEDSEGEDSEGEDSEGEDSEGEDSEGEDSEGEDSEGEDSEAPVYPTRTPMSKPGQ